MGKLFFAVTVLAIPGLPSGASVGRWALLFIAAAVMLFSCELSWWALVLLAYLLVMAFQATVIYDAAYLYFHAVVLVVLYAYAFQKLTDLRTVAIGVGLGFWVNSAAVLAQQFLNAAFIPQLTPHSGLFFNTNLATEGAAMAAALAISYEMWWLLPGIVPSLFWGSRSPVLALGCAVAWMLWRRSPWLAVGAAALTVAVIFGAHLDYITEAKMGAWGSLQERLWVWWDASAGFTVLGQGLGSWLTNFPLYQHHTSALEVRWENAHNDAVQIVFELGIVGAALVAGFVTRVWASPRLPEFYALVVFCIESLFGFPLYSPFTSALAAVCAGVLFSYGPPLFGYLASVGLLLRARYSDWRGHRLLYRQ